MSSDARKHETPDGQRILSGKRRAPRRNRSVAVKCLGPSGRSFTGRTVDISRGGVLIEITDPDFQPFSESSEILPFAARVAFNFPHGMDVNFGDGAVQKHANIVRLISKPGRATGMLLGCKFNPVLSDFDCRLLGIDPGSDETTAPAAPISPEYPASRAPAPVATVEAAQGSPAAPATPTASAPEPWTDGARPKQASEPRIYTLGRNGEGFQKQAAPAAAKAPKSARAPRADEPAVPTMNRADGLVPGSRQPTLSTWAADGTVVVHMFPANAPLHGPRFMGRLTNVRVRTALVEMPAPEDENDAGAWAAALGVTVRVVCIRDGRVLWETRARVMHVCAAETAGWARATLLAVNSPPLHTRKLLGLVPAGV